jgi:CheY-like chemotaxis protein
MNFHVAVTAMAAQLDFAVEAPRGCGPLNILIVDDNVDSAELIADWLALRGHTVSIAHDPLSALARMRDFEPDVAILDLGLPHMDGYELASHLRLNGLAECRIIFVTGQAERDGRRCAQLGISGYLVKPVDVDALTAVVEARLGQAF